MQFQRFRRPTPARLTRNEESEVRTPLHFRQLLPNFEHFIVPPRQCWLEYNILFLLIVRFRSNPKLVRLLIYNHNFVLVYVIHPVFSFQGLDHNPSFEQYL